LRDLLAAFLDFVLVLVDENSELFLEFRYLLGAGAVSELSGKLGLLLQEVDNFLVLVFDLADVLGSEAVEESLLSLGLHQVDVTLEVVDAGLPLGNGTFSEFSGASSSADIILNHNHESVSLILIVEVDTHVAFDSHAFDGQSAVVNLGLEFVEFALAIVLLVAEVVHLNGVGFDDVAEVLKLHLVKIEEIIERLLGSSDGVCHAFELGVLDVSTSLMVLAAHAYGKSLHAELVKLFAAFLTLDGGLLQSTSHLII